MAMRLPSIQIKAKVVVVGNKNVGKSSICTKIFGPSKSNALLVNTKIDFFMMDKTYELDGLRLLIKYLVWTLTGEARPEDAQPLLFAGADSVITMFAVDDKSSFNDAKRWVERLFSMMGPMPVILVANKIDLRNTKPDCIRTEEGEKMAEELSKKYDMPCFYVETSTETGEGLQKLERLLSQIIIWKKLSTEER